jgi:Domain of unknown function (DUF5668)
MKNKNTIWGGLLVFAGILFLGENMDWWHLSMRGFAKFWPLLLILAGVNYILNKKYDATPSGLTGILIFFAILFGTSYSVEKKVYKFGDKIEKTFDFDDDESLEDREDSKDNETSTGNFPIEMGNTEEATLNFTGGAGDFKFVEEDSKLFFGKSDNSRKQDFKLTSSSDGNKTTIDFNMKSKLNRKYDSDSTKISFDSDDFDNQVKMGLNKKPIWNFDMKIGAGKGDFDLSKYKVKNVEIQTGAASLELKLGDLVSNQDIKIESGLAKIVAKLRLMVE